MTARATQGVPGHRPTPHDARLKGAWLLGLAVLALSVVLPLALRRHQGPSHCGVGWLKRGPRCCAEGQSERRGSCVGLPTRCPPNFHLVQGQLPGCAFDAKRVRVGPLTVNVGPNDWQSEQVAPLSATVAAFDVDIAEVTYEKWFACVVCPAIATGEPGQSVTGISLSQAEQYCAKASGRLPSLAERMAMATGAQSRRFPWGQTGLACRRAAYGVVAGPCAEQGNQPDVTGCHEDGRSPEGLFDLSGNVAEIAVDAQGKAWACGGSFRSRTALELKSWACVAFEGPADDVGFRCAYAAGP